MSNTSAARYYNIVQSNTVRIIKSYSTMCKLPNEEHLYWPNLVIILDVPFEQFQARDHPIRSIDAAFKSENNWKTT